MKDPELTALSNQLDSKQVDFSFPAPSSPDRRLENFKLCTYLHGYGHCVRIRLGGQQRIIGRSSDVLKAAKFADLAIFRMWAFRRTVIREPHDGDFNFGLEMIRAEAKEDSTANQLMSEIIAHCTVMGYLKNREAKSFGGLALPWSRMRAQALLAVRSINCVGGQQARAVEKDLTEEVDRMDKIVTYVENYLKENQL